MLRISPDSISKIESQYMWGRDISGSPGNLSASATAETGGNGFSGDGLCQTGVGATGGAHHSTSTITATAVSSGHHRIEELHARLDSMAADMSDMAAEMSEIKHMLRDLLSCKP